ncbi:MAG: hypothetical protein AB4426_31840, partial [Xenococcaceae cyanobacterium]
VSSEKILIWTGYHIAPVTPLAAWVRRRPPRIRPLTLRGWSPRQRLRRNLLAIAQLQQIRSQFPGDRPGVAAV